MGALSVEETVKKDILSSEKKKVDFSDVIVDMIVRSRQGRSRNLKEFSRVFSSDKRDSSLYDEYLSILEDGSLKKLLCDEMKQVVIKLLRMGKLLWDNGISHNDAVYQNIFVKKSKKKGYLKCKFIDFDITVSFDKDRMTLYVPRHLCLENGVRQPITTDEIRTTFSYFFSGSPSCPVDDVTYLLPRLATNNRRCLTANDSSKETNSPASDDSSVTDEVDAENQLIYLFSDQETQEFYDEIFEIVKSSEMSVAEKWKAVMKLADNHEEVTVMENDEFSEEDLFDLMDEEDQVDDDDLNDDDYTVDEEEQDDDEVGGGYEEV